MARRKDKLIQNEYYSQWSKTINFFLTPDNKFKAFVYGQEIISDTMEELKREVYLALTEGAHYDWIPIVEVVLGAPMFVYTTETTVGLKIKLTRFYVAKITDENVWRLWDWEDYQKGRENFQHWSGLYRHQEEFREFPFSFKKGDEEIHFLPYTEELWNGLLKLVNALQALRERLADLMGTEQGRAIIHDVGTRLLLASLNAEEI